jgi:hypothetical protein
MIGDKSNSTALLRSGTRRASPSVSWDSLCRIPRGGLYQYCRTSSSLLQPLYIQPASWEQIPSSTPLHPTSQQGADPFFNPSTSNQPVGSRSLLQPLYIQPASGEQIPSSTPLCPTSQRGADPFFNPSTSNQPVGSRLSDRDQSAVQEMCHQGCLHIPRHLCISWSSF